MLVRDEAGTPVLYTAREGVLLGTVRDLALKLCPQLGIKVVEEPPSMAQLERAEEVRLARVPVEQRAGISDAESQHACARVPQTRVWQENPKCVLRAAGARMRRPGARM